MREPKFRHGAVSSPIVTPFDADDDDFDADALASHVETIVDAGLDGIVPGRPASSPASPTRERRTAVETTVEAANGRVPVIAGAADTTVVSGVRDRLRFAAAEAGADAGLITLPYYHTSTDPDGQRAFFERVADDAPLPRSICTTSRRQSASRSTPMSSPTSPHTSRSSG